MKSIITAITLALAAIDGALAADAVPLENAGVKPIASLDQVSELTKSAQKQFWQLIPPMDDPLYIHPGGSVFSADWRSGKWPDSVLKQMVAEMKTVNHSMYPIYRMTVVEERTGERVYYNSYDKEVWRTAAPQFYNPYLFALEFYGVESEKELTDQQRILGRSSNVGMELLLLPTVFMDSYEQDVALEEQEAVARLSVVPLIEKVRRPSEVANVKTLSDGTVLIELKEPASDAKEAFTAPAMMAMGATSGSGMLDLNPADGLSDVWVREMAGGVIDPLDSDLDGDGINFQFEHDLGLNPNVANPDFFKMIWSDIYNPPELALELNDVQGVNYELDENYDLVAGSWLHIPLSLNGNTNPAPYIVIIPHSATETFWRIRPAGFQDSGDDLLNDYEEYLLGTSIYTNDSDGDTLLDGFEFINLLNPTLADTDGDGLGDGWEMGYGFDPLSTTGTNGALGDADNDGFSNLEEQLNGTDPLIANSGGGVGTVATIRYHYDEDDRLTDFYSGAEVAQKTILTASHNISEEVSAK